MSSYWKTIILIIITYISIMRKKLKSKPNNGKNVGEGKSQYTERLSILAQLNLVPFVLLYWCTKQTVWFLWSNVKESAWTLHLWPA